MSPLLASIALQGAPADYLKDPAYAKPATVEIALAPLNKVVDAMAKASGLPLAASGVVIDLKATVLVKGLAIGRTMEALADTLGLVWRRDGTVLRLGRADGAAAAESAYMKEELTTVQSVARNSFVMDAPARMRMDAYANGQRTPRRRRMPQSEGGTVATAGPRFDPDLVAMETPGGAPPSRLEPSAPSGATAFATAVRAWPSVPADVDPAWSAPVSPANPVSTWEGGKLSLADLLVAWHKASGLPVVADAFRVPMKSVGFSPNTALGALQSLAGSERLSLRFADGVARMRHPAFWRLRAQEVSETAWQALERTGANLGSLSSFAANLKPAQASAFLSLESPLSRVNTTALREAYPGLLLWSALPDPARSALLAGRAVGLAQVQSAESAYVFALTEAPYYSAGDPSAVLAMSPAKVGIFGRPSATSLTLTLSGERGGGVGYVLPAP